MHLTNLILCLLLSAVTAITANGAKAAASLPLNDKVIEYCKENVDKEVGSGECAELAGHALKAAGAKIRTGPDAPRERDYVWGKLMYKIESTADGAKETGKLSDARPGDIIQFRDVNFGGKGGFGHHTAVLAEVADAESGKVQVYQQNAGGKHFVLKTTLHKFQDMKEGYIMIYRPVADK